MRTSAGWVTAPGVGSALGIRWEFRSDAVQKPYTGKYSYEFLLIQESEEP